MRLGKSKLSEAASQLGKKGWKARVEKYGLEYLQERMAKIGRASSGRPRLPDDQVSKNALYQRKRRAKLKAQAKSKKGGEKHGKTY
jgi:hypothetical protein